MSSTNKPKTKLSHSNSYTNNTHTRKTTAGNSNNKIARDLRQQFDQYVLKQQDEDSKQFQKQNQQQQQSGYQQNQQQQESYNQQQKQRQYSKSRKSLILSSTNKKPKLSIGKSSQRQSSKLRINNLINPNDINILNATQNSNIATNSVSIPKSYLLAMQHLQDLVQRKDEQISSLKIQLIEKQQIILESQQRINQVLRNYHALMDMYSKKQNQIVVLKEQMEQLRIDKQTALKHAAKFIQPQFKPFNDFKSHQTQQAFTTFKQRSMSTTIVPPYQRQLFTTAAFSKQLNLNNSFSPSIQLQNIKKHQPQIQTGKISQSQTSKTVYDNPFSSSRVPLSQKSRDRDFISYQRQILRNQKQLIALKYRMQCLQRKLCQDPKQQTIKQKIRKLTQQIQHKQKIINDLKKI